MTRSLYLNQFIFLLYFLISFQICKGQSYLRQQNQIFAYNILSNGIVGGIGGLINKPAGEKWHKAFIVNFGKGCIGGIVKYSAKRQTWYLQNNQNGFITIPNRLLYFAGHSMTMNASKHKGLFDTYYCNLWGADIRWNIKKLSKNSNPVQMRLSLYSLGSFISMLTDNNKLDIYKSLETGLFYFELDTNYSKQGLGIISGVSGFNTIAIRDPNLPFFSNFTLGHEIIHNYQSYDFFPITNLYYERFLKKKLIKNKWYNKISHFIVLDIDALYYSTAYAFQPKGSFYKNFFEYEAEHFASRKYIFR